VKGQLDVQRFSVWGAQVFAGIGRQAGTLTDRSVIISLRRKLEDEPVDRMTFELHERMTVTRRQLARWAADNASRIDASNSEPPACGNDRRLDNFTPLWRIADALGGPWPARIEAAYVVQGAGDEDDRPVGEMLLSDVWDGSKAAAEMRSLLSTSSKT
jgi:Protein of unknown function (DUF3631)